MNINPRATAQAITAGVNPTFAANTATAFGVPVLLAAVEHGTAEWAQGRGLPAKAVATSAKGASVGFAVTALPMAFVRSPKFIQYSLMGMGAGAVLGFVTPLAGAVGGSALRRMQRSKKLAGPAEKIIEARRKVSEAWTYVTMAPVRGHEILLKVAQDPKSSPVQRWTAVAGMITLLPVEMALNFGPRLVFSPDSAAELRVARTTWWSTKVNSSLTLQGALWVGVGLVGSLIVDLLTGQKRRRATDPPDWVSEAAIPATVPFALMDYMGQSRRIPSVRELQIALAVGFGLLFLVVGTRAAYHKLFARKAPSVYVSDTSDFVEVRPTPPLTPEKVAQARQEYFDEREAKYTEIYEEASRVLDDIAAMRAADLADLELKVDGLQPETVEELADIAEAIAMPTAEEEEIRQVLHAARENGHRPIPEGALEPEKVEAEPVVEKTAGEQAVETLAEEGVELTEEQTEQVKSDADKLAEVLMAAALTSPDLQEVHDAFTKATPKPKGKDPVEEFKRRQTDAR